MHIDILSKEQQDLLPYIAQFKRTFYLVGGTAIALHIGHRRSIDYDLFTLSTLNKTAIKQKLRQIPYKQNLIFEDYDQIHFNLNNVKVTFFNYLYAVEHSVKLDKIISMPSLLSLAAMKAFALGRRAKWKDYVDLYFILKDHYSVQDVANRATKMYGDHFSEKLFRQQLAFHKDIDHREAVEYLTPTPPADSEIRETLIDIAISEVVA